MDAWSGLLKKVDAAVLELGFKPEDGEEPWFRGQADSTWNLNPSLNRVKGKNLVDLEVDLYYEFSSKARELHASRLDSWEILFIMRHHGIVTRVLDWTEQFGIALYFALHEYGNGSKEGGITGKPALWVLNPFALNQIRGGWGYPGLVSPASLFDGKKKFKEYLDVLSWRAPWPYAKPIAIYPRQVSSRQQAQSGWFTIHGRDRRPLNDIAASTVRRIDLEPAEVVAGREFLKRAGINEYLLFPDLDGLARSLHEKYGLDRIANPLAAVAGTVKEQAKAGRRKSRT